MGGNMSKLLAHGIGGGVNTYSASPVSAPEMLAGNEAFVNGQKVVGTMPFKDTAQNWQATAVAVDGTGSIVLRPPLGYFEPPADWTSGGWVYANDADFVSANIKDGVDLFGKVGTCQSLINAGDWVNLANQFGMQAMRTIAMTNEGMWVADLTNNMAKLYNSAGTLLANLSAGYILTFPHDYNDKIDQFIWGPPYGTTGYMYRMSRNGTVLGSTASAGSQNRSCQLSSTRIFQFSARDADNACPYYGVFDHNWTTIKNGSAYGIGLYCNYNYDVYEGVATDSGLYFQNGSGANKPSDPLFFIDNSGNFSTKSMSLIALARLSR